MQDGRRAGLMLGDVLCKAMKAEYQLHQAREELRRREAMVSALCEREEQRAAALKEAQQALSQGEEGLEERIALLEQLMRRRLG